MDDFKKTSVKNFTAWDLNADCVQKRPKERKKLVKMFTRNSRRTMKQNLKKEIENE